MIKIPRLPYRFFYFPAQTAAAPVPHSIKIPPHRHRLRLNHSTSLPAMATGASSYFSGSTMMPSQSQRVGMAPDNSAAVVAAPSPAKVCSSIAPLRRRPLTPSAIPFTVARPPLRWMHPHHRPPPRPLLRCRGRRHRSRWRRGPCHHHQRSRGH
jgi:hypothetical protein